jgi:nucleotide-binding universal stress UspA family protein
MESTAASHAKPMKVVAGIDFSSASGAVLRRALEIANRTPGTEIHAVTVPQYAYAVGIDGVSQTTIPDSTVAELQQLVSAQLAAFSKSSPQAQLGRVVTHVLGGSPAHEIVWLAARLDADLIIVGTHGRRGAARLVLGSVAEQVVRTAGCPVFIERPKQHNEAWKVPELEPPCPDCLKARQASGGEKLWCERHLGEHFHAHVYSYSDSAGSAFRPWGFSNT